MDVVYSRYLLCITCKYVWHYRILNYQFGCLLKSFWPCCFVVLVLEHLSFHFWQLSFIYSVKLPNRGIFSTSFFKERIPTFWLYICMVFSGIVLVGLNKNLDYYGSGYDGFIKMFGHGVGIYLIPFLESISFPALVGITVFIAIILNYIAKKFQYPFLARILFCCFACGLFGYTTLSMAIVPLLIIFTPHLPDFVFSKDR